MDLYLNECMRNVWVLNGQRRAYYYKLWDFRSLVGWLSSFNKRLSSDPFPTFSYFFDPASTIPTFILKFLLFPTFSCYFILQLQQILQGYHVGIVSSHCRSSGLKAGSIYLAPPYATAWICGQPVVGLQYAHKVSAVIPVEDNWGNILSLVLVLMNRWSSRMFGSGLLTLGPAMKRVTGSLESVHQYFFKDLPNSEKESNTEKTLEGNERYRMIYWKLIYPVARIQLAVFLST